MPAPFMPAMGMGAAMSPASAQSMAAARTMTPASFGGNAQMGTLAGATPAAAMPSQLGAQTPLGGLAPPGGGPDAYQEAIRRLMEQQASQEKTSNVLRGINSVPLFGGMLQNIASMFIKPKQAQPLPPQLPSQPAITRTNY